MNEISNRFLIVVRHAHRETGLGRSEDNSLTEKGTIQARAFAEYHQDRLLNSKILLLSSPRQRCKETLAPLAEVLKLKIKVELSLDEGEDLLHKFGDFLKIWNSHSTDSMVICSHGDWIPEFSNHVLGIPISLQKGGFIELRWNQKRLGFELEKIIQKLV